MIPPCQNRVWTLSRVLDAFGWAFKTCCRCIGIIAFDTSGNLADGKNVNVYAMCHGFRLPTRRTRLSQRPRPSLRHLSFATTPCFGANITESRLAMTDGDIATAESATQHLTLYAWTQTSHQRAATLPGGSRAPLAQTFPLSHRL
jgi:hypothetical protein